MTIWSLGGERIGYGRVLVLGLLQTAGCSSNPMILAESKSIPTVDAPLEGPSPVDQDTEAGRVIDPGGPMFSGAGFWASSSWWESSDTPGYYGPGYMVAPTIESSDPAEYWWEEPRTAWRSVAAWWTAGGNRSERVTYVAVDGDGRELDRRVISQTSGGGAWQPLFDVTFPAGRATVLLSRWDEPGRYVVADALRVRACGTSDVEPDPEPGTDPDPEPVSEPS